MGSDRRAANACVVFYVGQEFHLPTSHHRRRLLPFLPREDMLYPRVFLLSWLCDIAQPQERRKKNEHCSGLFGSWKTPAFLQMRPLRAPSTQAAYFRLTRAYQWQSSPHLVRPWFGASRQPYSNAAGEREQSARSKQNEDNILRSTNHKPGPEQSHFCIS